MQIHVDSARESVLLPINDQLVPFHVNTIRRVTRSEEGNINVLRFQFHVPDTNANRAKAEWFPGMKYISEISYRSMSTALQEVYFQVDQLKKFVTSRLKEQEATKSIVAQEELRLDRRSTPPQLKDIMVRPALSRKKTTVGLLTAHLNGFRYVTADKIKVDIIYSNIKSAFYQPAQDSHNVILHFELKDPILLDKAKAKKTNFLQFYVEVVEVSEDLTTANRYRDEDGLAEEQAERKRKKRMNERFLEFVKEVEEKLARGGEAGVPKIEFDVPYNELGFMGVPAKQQVMIMPTVHSLIALDDTPPMVLALSEVEIAVFERIQFGLKEFDLVFVWKDFNKLPMRIEAIPIKSFEPVKHWLNSCDIVFYESPQNMLWKQIMKQITKGKLSIKTI